MQINVSQQLKNTIGDTRDYEVNGSVDIDNMEIPILGKVRLIRTDRGILVKSNIRSETVLTCGRCLREFKYSLNLNIEEEYYPTTDINTGLVISIPDEPDCFIIDEHNILDLTDAICQYALMAVPIKPLCNENCAGLCPTCGANLNEISCECPSIRTDPRWNELHKLIESYIEKPLIEKKGSR